jgi:hypothetical protein
MALATACIQWLVGERRLGRRRSPPVAQSVDPGRAAPMAAPL